MAGTVLKTKLQNLELSSKFCVPLGDALQVGLEKRCLVIAGAIPVPRFRTSWTSDNNILKTCYDLRNEEYNRGNTGVTHNMLGNCHPVTSENPTNFCEQIISQITFCSKNYFSKRVSTEILEVLNN